MLAGLLLAGPASAQAPALGTEDKVEALLVRLRLVELQILHLEKALTRPHADRKQVLVTARRLADLYAHELLRVADPKKVQDLLRRVQDLLRAHPEANTPALQVMLLQSDYQRAEALVRKWMTEPTEAAARAEAQRILAGIVPGLASLQDKLHQALKQGNETLEKLPDGPGRTQYEQEVHRLEMAAGRASFYAGWASYYLGLMKPAQPGGNPEFALARLSFRKLFDGDEPEEGTDIEELALEIEGRAQAGVGLALAEMACGDVAAGLAWFKLLRDPRAHAQVRDLLGYWLIGGLLNAGQVSQAKAEAEKEIATFSDAYTPGKVALCTLLIRGPVTGGVSAAQKQELALLGLRGLLRMRQLDLARKLIDKHGIEIGTPQGFVMLWMTGQNLFEKAEKSKTPDDYQAAAQSLLAALAAPDARQQPQLAAECRYWLGWCYYRVDDLNKALTQLTQAATALKALKSSLAADAAWTVAGIHLRLAAKDPKHLAAAREAYQAFKHEFPHHDNARKVDSLLFKLRPDVPSLEDLDPKDPNYPDHCLIVCQRLFQEWQKARSDGQKGPAAARALQAAIDRFLALPAADKYPEGKLACLLMAVDLALASRPQSLPLAQKQLTQADPIGMSLKPTDRLAVRYRYFKLQLAQKAQDTRATQEHALWLSQHGRGTDYEDPGLVALVQLAEAPVKQATEAQRAAIAAQTLPLYRRLVEIRGDTSDKLRSDKSALFVSSALAAAAHTTGRHEEEARQLEKMLQAFPDSQDYLRRAGRAYYHTQKLDRSLECWRILLKGLPAASEGWFEAKYYQLAALAQVDKKQAREVFRQLKLLHPSLGPPSWRPKLQELEKTLASQ